MTELYSNTQEGNLKNQSSDQFVDVCVEGGIKLLRLHPETKKPVGPEWQLKTTPPEQIKAWVANRCTLGWQMGEVSGGIAAVDCDCGEAELLASKFLRDTLKIAKGDHPPSIYVYRC